MQTDCDRELENVRIPNVVMCIEHTHPNILTVENSQFSSLTECKFLSWKCLYCWFCCIQFMCNIRARVRVCVYGYMVMYMCVSVVWIGSNIYASTKVYKLRFIAHSKLWNCEIKPQTQSIEILIMWQWNLLIETES